MLGERGYARITLAAAALVLLPGIYEAHTVAGAVGSFATVLVLMLAWRSAEAASVWDDAGTQLRRKVTEIGLLVLALILLKATMIAEGVR